MNNFKTFIVQPGDHNQFIVFLKVAKTVYGVLIRNKSVCEIMSMSTSWFSYSIICTSFKISFFPKILLIKN